MGLKVIGHTYWTDPKYLRFNSLGFSQAASALAFLSWMVVAACQAMDVSYLIRNDWAIVVSFTCVIGVISIIWQGISLFSYFMSGKAGGMATEHNTNVYGGALWSAISFVLVISFQYYWLNKYQPTWVKQAIDIATGTPAEVRTYFAVAIMTVAFSLVAAYALTRAVASHLYPIRSDENKN
jgi:hypothetical protein